MSIAAGSVPEPATGAATLVDLLRWRARNEGDRVGYTFLADGEREESSLSYGELDRRARAVGGLLQQLGAAGQRALLLYPPGLDFVGAFFGCLYAGTVAVPAYPPHAARPQRALPQIRAIAADAAPAVVLTTGEIRMALAGACTAAGELRSVSWLATDTLRPGSEEAWRTPSPAGHDLAFLQYTSGSTASPKGVMVSHGNLMHNSRLIESFFEHTTASRGVIWLPPYHDMGLIGGIVQPLFVGFPVTLMSPLAFLQRPLRWLQAIARCRATTSGGPNFAYDLCVRKTTPEQRAGLDLGCWSVAFNGAEPVRGETLDRFAAAFAPCGLRRESLYPCYGLAEATLIVSGGGKAEPPVRRSFDAVALERNRVEEVAAGDGDARRLCGCGRSPPDQIMAIVDADSGERCPSGRVGEIWVSGPSVARGYWSRPAATRRTFHARLAGRSFLRTGDLGFLHRGELFVTGRRKELIILDGRNHYPQDVERVVEGCHPALQVGGCAAFAVDGEAGEGLVVVAEVSPRRHRRGRRPMDAAEVVRQIRRAVADRLDVGVRTVALVKAGTIPRTSSGKLRRGACRDAFLSGALESVEVWR